MCWGRAVSLCGIPLLTHGGSPTGSKHGVCFAGLQGVFLSQPTMGIHTQGAQKMPNCCFLAPPPLPAPLTSRSSRHWRSGASGAATPYPAPWTARGLQSTPFRLPGSKRRRITLKNTLPVDCKPLFFPCRAAVARTFVTFSTSSVGGGPPRVSAFLAAGNHPMTHAPERCARTPSADAAAWDRGIKSVILWDD